MNCQQTPLIQKLYFLSVKRGLWILLWRCAWLAPNHYACLCCSGYTNMIKNATFKSIDVIYTLHLIMSMAWLIDSILKCQYVHI